MCCKSIQQSSDWRRSGASQSTPMPSAGARCPHPEGAPELHEKLDRDLCAATLYPRFRTQAPDTDFLAHSP